ncbi:glutaredoxin family protein [Microbacterium aerolatum]|uniref:Thioredoxin family protein n=1 Tax=Microbacterium aerolatum TaxID=153731 RepID=A0A511ADW7_9MICO|nr:glutaredoxin family protein [Microbacterium aerolatum]GEK86350.1 thioredoxin family protein [Microbacterium aerolatum]GGB17271.1 thioredoxin family protein [Microbacterium aerolatum]
MTTITVIGKHGCHLCPTALGIVEEVVAGLPDEIGDDIEIVERSIEDDLVLYDLWWEKIPVVLIDDEVHAHWRVSPDKLRQRLENR